MKLRNLLAGALVAGLGCAAVPAAAQGNDGLEAATPDTALAADLRVALSPYPPRWIPPWTPPRHCERIYPVRPYASPAPQVIGYEPPWMRLCRPPVWPPYPHPMRLLGA